MFDVQEGLVMPFPIRHEAHTLEQESRNFLRNHLPVDWVANQPQDDYGIDFQIEIPEDGQLRGLELIIQLKAAKNGTGSENTETVSLRVATFNYLRRNLRVVMIIKYVKSANEAYWIFLRDVNPPHDENQKSFTVHIPKTNRLSATNWDQIKTLIRMITNKKLGAVNG
jgi:hypothetical protein